MDAINNLFNKIWSAFFLIVLSPLLLVIAIAIKLNSTGPIFYKQIRVGLNNKTFRIFKFRTMIINAEYIGGGINVSKNDKRITRVGKFLRKYSLDELPQLINILKGDMNFIGPRPTIPNQVKKYTPKQMGRLKIKPGLTGWAQVNGRNALSWPERIDLDLWYIKNRNIWIDTLIIAKTFTTVINKRGIYTK